MVATKTAGKKPSLLEFAGCRKQGWFTLTQIKADSIAYLVAREFCPCMEN